MFRLFHDAKSARRYVYAFFALLVLIAGTWAIGRVHVERAEAIVERDIQESVSEALDFAEADLRGLQEDLIRRGEELASSEDVLRSLRAYHRQGTLGTLEPLVRVLKEKELPQRTAATVYDTNLKLLAWNGFALPYGEIVREPDFDEGVRIAIVRDSDVRRALSVWVPIRDGARTVGHMRTMHLLDERVPVENRYLSHYSRSTQWWRATGLEVRFETNERFRPVDLDENERLIRSDDGRVLGRLTAEPPAPAAVVASLEVWYEAILLFWVTLLLAWGITGLWFWYRRADGHPRDLVLRFAVFAVAWWGVRYALIALDVPARWQQPRAPLAPLFDPTHFASTFGGGLMRSTGDFAISALFGLVFAFVTLGLVRTLIRHAHEHAPASNMPASRIDGRALGTGLGAVLLGVLLLLGGTIGLGQVVRHALRDSTLDYFTTSGLLPDPLVLTVFCTLLITGLIFVVLAVAVVWAVADVVQRAVPSSMYGPLAVVAAVVFVATGLAGLPGELPWYMVLVVGFIVTVAAWIGLRHLGPDLELLSLRSVLLTVVVLAVLLYPMFYSGMHQQRQVQMLEAAVAFEEGQDPRAVFAIEQLLKEAQDDAELRDLLSLSLPPLYYRSAADSLAASLLQNSLLVSLGSYDVSLTVFDAMNRVQGRHDAPGAGGTRSMLDRADSYEFRILRQMYEDALSFGPRVEQITGRREPDRFQYAGIVPIRTEGWDPFEQPVGWVMVRAEPRVALVGETTPFPRVLLPGGSYGDLTQHVSLAEFRDGRLVRSLGPSFGRHRLDPEIREAVAREGQLWRSEQTEDQRFLTFYQYNARPERPISFPGSQPGPTANSSILAVRVPAIGIFDHLYYLLRLTVAGFVIALPFYLVGLMLRWRAGLLPAPYVRFRDRALNAFLLVGIIAVAAVGLIGQRVIVAEADNAVKGWLRQHLERVEEALALEAQGNEMPYHVIERVSADELAARAGVDLNIYQQGQLIATNRPQLLRDRLIEERMPPDIYHALYYDGYRLRFSEEQLGSFTYMAGYYALPDEQGAPRYVVSVPTLPEQERIEQERARTVAYLFGALLLLILTVMLVASMLAGALARPIARLRTGLEDVAKGRFEQTIQVSTRDEIGELVETFNTMQGQLAESRRKLAQQERQLAWREMARQVAHEIKNPLTPMKLSVQNLRRAFEDAELRNGSLTQDDPDRTARFATYFDRVTSTLIEQINTLARIADEFSTFARLPQRVLERLDLNAVIREAVSLMQAEAEVDISMALHSEPLVIEADREEVRRVFINLIKNALQAVSDEQKAMVRIWTERLERDDTTWAACAIEDNGTGIPPEVRDRIFEPNFSTKTSGTGLGLPIVKKSIEDMDGAIRFETDVGVGTTFYVRLPLAEE